MLDPLLEELARGANFAAFTTILDGGQPQTSIMWVDCDSDHVLINTEIERLKFRNVQHDPRVDVVVWDRDNPYRYVEVRGVVEETVSGSEAREHIDSLSVKYTGQAYANPIGSPRVILKIRPSRQRRQGS